MAVYVDDAQNAFGRMKMCHLLADTTDELLAMVDTIGVQRKWIQFRGTYREHFDIALSKRALAVKAGAIEVSTEWIADFRNRKRGSRKRVVERSLSDEAPTQARRSADSTPTRGEHMDDATEGTNTQASGSFGGTPIGAGGAGMAETGPIGEARGGAGGVAAGSSAYKPIPDTVVGEASRDLYRRTNDVRAALKLEGAAVKKMADAAKRVGHHPVTEDRGEVIANLMLALRHIEDASMRCGKVLQALDGGVSVYDRATTVGA